MTRSTSGSSVTSVCGRCLPVDGALQLPTDVEMGTDRAAVHALVQRIDSLADLGTTVTELTTGLGMLGFSSLDEALSAQKPKEMVSVSPETWERLRQAHDGRGPRGRVRRRLCERGGPSYDASEGLRGRPTAEHRVEGSRRAPATRSRPSICASTTSSSSAASTSRGFSSTPRPSTSSTDFCRAPRRRGGDWFAQVAAGAYQELYRRVRRGRPGGSPGGRRRV